MGLIENIKSNAAKSGANKDKIFFVKSDSKVRVRFLQELDTGYEFTFHDSYQQSINTLCREELGKTCPLCGDESLRTRTLYAWSVYNYDTKKVEVMLFAVNNCTPVSQLVSMYENYGTIMDRDYVLAKSGKQQNTTYTVIPQDKQRFRNAKAKPYTKSAVLKILDKAYPMSDEFDEEFDVDDTEVDEEDERKEIKEIKSSKRKKENYRYLKDPIPGIDDDFDEEDEEEGEERPARKSRKKSSKSVKYLTTDEIEDILDDNDIDEDDFLDYMEIENIKKIKRTKKAFMADIDEYLEFLEDEEDE